MTKDYQRRDAEAVESARKSYRAIERANGPNASATLKGAFVYGNILLATDDIEASKAIRTEVRAQREVLLGGDCFMTKDSNYVVGEI